MRQAGRYQARYREIRSRYSMIELCRTPEAVTEVTLLPIEQFDLDAAIIFSDITIPFLGMGVGFDIVSGVGPVIEAPIRSEEDLARLQDFDAESSTSFVGEAIRMLRRELKVPLIGFAGAPFTLAAYLVEGKPSRDFKLVRQMIYSEPELWNRLMEHLSEATISYLAMQARAGAQALQVFDSWVGGLHPVTYQQAVFPHMKRIFDELASFQVPLIHFGTGTASLLPLMKETGGDVIGIDWKTPLGEAWSTLGDGVAVQGNLDPAVLFAPFETVQREVDRILDEAGGRPGHIFNLGHGVLPGTPEETVKRLVQYVRERSSG